MAKRSAGLLMYRIFGGELQVLLVHPGGPFWQKKDTGAWFVPKGEVADGEDDLAAARREFGEETGLSPEGQLISLGSAKHRSGKTVVVWAFEGNCNPNLIKSNTFTMEWPPKSGKQMEFPEIDRGNFWSMADARSKILPAEAPFLDALEKALGREMQHPPSKETKISDNLFDL